MTQSNRISFKGQNIYVGIDVHLKSWSVTVLSETSVLKRMSRGADPDALHRFLTSTILKRSITPCTKQGSVGSGYTTG